MADVEETGPNGKLHDKQQKKRNLKADDNRETSKAEREDGNFEELKKKLFGSP